MDTSNCKNNIHGKYSSVVDHVYCPNENYIRTNAGSLDVMALLKENKQLKAMLLLHIDLIQEQSDQLLAKDKLLANLKDENESLKLQIDKYERNYGKSGNEIIKKSTTTKTVIHTTNKNLPVKKLIEEKKENLRDFTHVDQQQPTNINNKKSISSSTCDDKKNKNSSTTPLISIRSRQTPSPSTEGTQQQKSPMESKYKIYDENTANCSSIIGQSNGKLISKIILHRVQIPESMIIPKKDSDQIIKPIIREELQESQQQQKLSTSYKQKSQQIQFKTSRQSDSSTINISSSKICDDLSSTITADDKNEIKSMDIKSENIDIEIKSENIIESEDIPSTSFVISPQKDMPDQNSNINNKIFDQNFEILSDNKRKCSVLTTCKCYSSREWIDEDIPPEEWSNKEEEEALKADAPMLEIPKWTVKEFSGLYSIEGTEDLTDDTFTKRHAKFEYDEKRRKKWDAQRIREQRTIERLKRRHCKDELQEIDNQEFSSFYPKPDSIKIIQITDELPVLAFGECIPRLSNVEFHLPWTQRYLHQIQQQNDNISNNNQNTSYVFLKKRQRQQSVSVNSLRKKTFLTANTTTTTGNPIGIETNNENFTSIGFKKH